MWTNVIFTLLRDPEGHPAHVIGMHEDITERKQTEQAPRRSESRNAAILRRDSGLMFLQTQDGTYLDYYTKDPQDLWVPQSSSSVRECADVLPASLAAKLEQCFAEATFDEPGVAVVPASAPERHPVLRGARCPVQ